MTHRVKPKPSSEKAKRIYEEGLQKDRRSLIVIDIVLLFLVFILGGFMGFGVCLLLGLQ